MFVVRTYPPRVLLMHVHMPLILGFSGQLYFLTVPNIYSRSKRQIRLKHELINHLQRCLSQHQICEKKTAMLWLKTTNASFWWPKQCQRESSCSSLSHVTLFCILFNPHLDFQTSSSNIIVCHRLYNYYNLWKFISTWNSVLRQTFFFFLDKVGSCLTTVSSSSIGSVFTFFVWSL